MERPRLKSRSMDIWKIEGLPVVVITVTSTACMENTLAMSTIGIMWLVDKKGRKLTIRLFVSAS